MIEISGNAALKNEIQIARTDVIAPRGAHMTLQRAFELAKEAGYKYFYFEREIFEVCCTDAWMPTGINLFSLR